MAARDFSNAGLGGAALLARGVSFYDQDDAEKEIWSAWFWGALPAITGSGAVTLDAVTSAGSGSSGTSSGVPSRLRIGSSPRGYRGRGMSPERRR